MFNFFLSSCIVIYLFGVCLSLFNKQIKNYFCYLFIFFFRYSFLCTFPFSVYFHLPVIRRHVFMVFLVCLHFWCCCFIDLICRSFKNPKPPFGALQVVVYKSRQVSALKPISLLLREKETPKRVLHNLWWTSLNCSWYFIRIREFDFSCTVCMALFQWFHFISSKQTSVNKEK